MALGVDTTNVVYKIAATYSGFGRTRLRQWYVDFASSEAFRIEGQSTRAEENQGDRDTGRQNRRQAGTNEIGTGPREQRSRCSAGYQCRQQARHWCEKADQNAEAGRG
jgi:hypothetical protein